MKLTAYIAITGHLTRARQEWMMREYDAVHTVEDLDEAIKHMRKGRGLLVAQCSVLGRRADGIEAAARRIHDRGGIIVEAATGRDSSGGLDTFLMGLHAGRRKALTSPKARKMATKYQKDDDRLVKARAMWGEHKYTIDQIAAKVGIPRSTLIRRLGKREGVKPGPKR